MASNIGIKITVDDKGAISSFQQVGKAGQDAGKKLSQSFDQSEKSVSNFSAKSLIASASVVAIGYSAFKTGKYLVDLADRYSLMTSQIRLVVDAEQNLIETQKDILRVANETRQSVSATTELYTRLDRATESLALTDREVLNITETLNKAIIISGASSIEAEAAIRQLSQGMASGTLRGEELNSILEQTPRVAKLIADGMGVTVGELRKLGAEGLLTTEAIVQGITKQSTTINEEFSKVEKTGAQAWIQLKNNAESYIATVTQATGLQKAFVAALDLVSKGIKTISDNENREQGKQLSPELRSLEQQTLIIAELIELQKNRASISADWAKKTEDEIFKETLYLEAIKRRKSAEEEEIKTKKDQQKADNEKTTQEVKNAEIAKEASKKRTEEIKKLNEQIRLFNELKKEQNLLDNQSAVNNAAIDAEREALEFSKEIREERNQLFLSDFDFKIQKIEEEKNARIEALKSIELSEQEHADILASINESAERKKQNAYTVTEDIRKRKELQHRMDIANTASLAVDLLNEVFGKNKAFAIADIIINTARGIMRSFSELPPPLNAIQAGLIGGLGVAQIAKVSGAKFADGTKYVEGRGTNRSDSIPAMLSVGERVIDSNTNAKLGGVSNQEILNAVNGGGRGVNITINAGAGTDGKSLAQVIVNELKRAKMLGLEPSVI